MTTASENEILTRVGPGTPMGELMRQYWIPAAMDFTEKGLLPQTATRPGLYRGPRCGHFIAAAGVEWRDAYADVLKNSPWESVGMDNDQSSAKARAAA